MPERNFKNLFKIDRDDIFTPIKSVKAGNVWAHIYDLRKNRYVRFSYSRHGATRAREIYNHGVLQADLISVLGLSLYLRSLGSRSMHLLKKVRKNEIQPEAIWEALQGALEDRTTTRKKLLEMREEQAARKLKLAAIRNKKKKVKL